MTRGAAKAFTAGLLLPGLLLWFAPRALGDYEIVPEGRLLIDAGVTSEQVERAITTRNVEGSLLEYLVPDSSVNSQITGEIDRESERFDLRIQYGFSDHWNFSLDIPFLRITQNSTLASGSGSQLVQQQVTRLQSRSISGLGSLRLMSLRREIFQDRHAFVWGAGISVPGDSPQSPYAGRGTLYLGSPFRTLIGLVQYESYQLEVPGRIEARAELHFPQERWLTDLNGDPVSVFPGNRLLLSLGWEREFGALFTSINARMDSLSRSRVNEETIGDRVKETVVRLRLGTGNLRKLEEGPVGFPFLIYFQFERTVQGYNIPIRSEASVFLKTYF